MLQFLMLFNPVYTSAMPPPNTMTTADLTVFKAISRNKKEPAHVHAVALLCRSKVCENIIRYVLKAPG